MDKVSKVQHSSKANNNSKPQNAYSQGDRRGNDKDRSLQQKLLYEQRLQLEKMRAVVNDLEKLKKSMESKIVTAPLKNDVVVPVKPNINRVDITKIDRDTNIAKKRVIQSYTGAIKPQTRPTSTQINSYKQLVAKPQAEMIKQEPKKTSLWDRMKKAVKDFFGVEEKTTSPMNYSNDTWSNRNETASNYVKPTSFSDRSQQYRKSMSTNINATYNPKNTQSQYKTDPNRGKRLDRYV